ncbi:hypothetical protein BGZ61DRAFT_446833 [Ilyonectria robusta]|uniref:uncharacterized protein n=1 Tax=Ilyonectria robusta TaxID=1079257 RepID=UPI001E8E9120|nr:uncharacterized protein BGZ61DRAFT_446833 [Ilyonectria robusta]KAH8729687.1 hypothetical protein BGZ61DRAFT_446833 [Ilyonectria robusta]
MGNDDILTDDYVAGLLSQEANDCSLKYSTMGMDAFRTDKKPANMLKPNTRFLRHIIKDTDTHNKALLAKEAAESRARLKDLERTEELKRRKTNPNSRDIRKRQMGDIHAILGGKKRRPTGDQEAPSSSRNSKSRETSRRSDKDQDLFKDRREERKHRGRLSRSEGRHSKSDSRSHREERRKRSRSRDSGSEEDRSRHSRKRRDRSRSPERRRRSRSPRERKDSHRHRSPLHDTKGKSKQTEEQEADDSDMDDLIGPAPPPKYRGRGAVGGSSGIDRRFSDTYDPKTDVQMDDDAFEAFRDRQKLKQNQEQRMRAAGFADDQVQRATSTDEKLADSVQWSKAGEKREWDRGKGVGSDGVVASDEEL